MFWARFMVCLKGEASPGVRNHVCFNLSFDPARLADLKFRKTLCPDEPCAFRPVGMRGHSCSATLGRDSSCSVPGSNGMFEGKVFR